MIFVFRAFGSPVSIEENVVPAACPAVTFSLWPGRQVFFQVAGEQAEQMVVRVLAF